MHTKHKRRQPYKQITVVADNDVQEMIPVVLASSTKTLKRVKQVLHSACGNTQVYVKAIAETEHLLVLQYFQSQLMVFL